MIRFRVSGTTVEISYLLTALVSLSVILSGKESLMPLCLFCALVHEAGHLSLMYTFRVLPQKISLTLTDIRIISDFTYLSPVRELLIALAGPFANLLMTLISSAVYFCFGTILFKQIALTSLFVGVFNLLPVNTLDGEQILLLMFFRNTEEKRKNIIINVISFFVIAPLATAGCILLFLSKYNYTLLLVAVYLLISVITKEMR